jgi:superkiller protein 3
MGNAFADLQDYHEAIRCYKKAINIDPNDADVYHNMGLVYYILGNKQEGIKNLQKAARLEDKDVQEWLRKNGYSW